MFGKSAAAPVDLRVEGAEQLGALARRLRDAGSEGRGFRKETLGGIRKAVGGPMRKATRESWRGGAPRRGRLNRSGLRMTVKTNTRNGANLGVRLVTKSAAGYSMADIDEGRLRHPVFAREGRKPRWVEQSITPGLITKPQEAAAPAVRAEVIRAIQAIARRVEG